MTDKQNMHIEHLKVDDIIPYAKNARTHSDTQVSQIAASMTEFGFVNPILIAEDNTIIAGHGRLMAATLKPFQPFAWVIWMRHNAVRW